MIRITLICPEPLLAEGRALLLALGTGPQDADALHLSDWRNGATGAAVAVASSEMPEDWLLQLSAPLQRPRSSTANWVNSLSTVFRCYSYQ